MFVLRGWQMLDGNQIQQVLGCQLKPQLSTAASDCTFWAQLPLMLGIYAASYSWFRLESRMPNLSSSKWSTAWGTYYSFCSLNCLKSPTQSDHVIVHILLNVLCIHYFFGSFTIHRYPIGWASLKKPLCINSYWSWSEKQRMVCSCALLPFAFWAYLILLSSGRGSNSNEILVYFLPHKSHVCEKMFQEEGISANVNIQEFPLFFVPFDFDLLSLEMESSFKVKQEKYGRLGYLEIVKANGDISCCSLMCT